MLNGQIDQLGAQVAKIFRHGTEQERLAALRRLDNDASALAQRKITEADLMRQWSNSLLTYLTAHPEARQDVASLASSGGKTTVIGSQSFHGPTSFGGDNNGTINL